MTPEPSFIDNRDGNTLAHALGSLLGVSPESQVGEPTEKPDQVSIATAFFSPTGFAHIADHLEEIPEVRLLLGEARSLTAAPQVSDSLADVESSQRVARQLERPLHRSPTQGRLRA